MTFGTVVHESMEMIALDGSVDDVVETVASINELEPELIEEATAAVNNYLASDVVRAALRGMHERELPIIGAIDGTPIDGVIDLLYQDSTTGEWVIGDYKTDAYCSPKRIRGYFVQLQLYAKLLDRDVSRIELYFLGDSGVEVRSLELNS
nr:PD-(D/E)XK nuclease family protein [Corynebacterium sp. CCUG 69979]